MGPYARLRPGTVLEPSSKVGNFVELKNTKLGQLAKVNHLAYVGDSEVGAWRISVRAPSRVITMGRKSIELRLELERL